MGYLAVGGGGEGGNGWESRISGFTVRGMGKRGEREQKAKLGRGTWLWRGGG